MSKLINQISFNPRQLHVKGGALAFPFRSPRYIDLIVDHEDKYYFLEVNPNGQWRFIEERAGLSIGEAIAHLVVA